MLTDKVVILTGGASGIGLAAVEILCRENAKVAFFDIQKDKGEQAVTKLRDKGYEVSFFEVDVTNFEDVSDAVNTVREKYSRIDVLVNNAAIQITSPADETLEEDWDRIFSVNVKGYFLCAKAVLPAMREQKDGVIINIASVQGIMPAPRSSAYASSKGSIITFTKTLALDYGPENIRSVGIAPGSIETPLLHKFYNAEALQQMKLSIPMNRLGKPEEIGELIAFIASGRCGYLSGSTLTADGGLTAYVSA